jgi:hypothetical protein
MVSDWFQDVFGISNFTIAKAMIMSAFIIGLISDLGFYRGSFDIGSILFVIIIKGLLCTFIVSKIKSHEDFIRRNPQYQNLYAYVIVNKMFPILICFTLIFVTNSIRLNIKESLHPVEKGHIQNPLDIVSDLLFCLHFYFLACTQKPRKKSKIKKAMDKAKEKINEVKENLEKRPEPTFGH